MDEYTFEEIYNIKKHIFKYNNYKLKSNWKPFICLIKTLIGLICSILLTKKYYIGIPIYSCFILRTFIIFHDCCHRSFFKRISYNQVIAQIVEPIVMYTEYDWKIVHGNHHSVHGNLSEMDIIKTVITKKTYDNMSLTYKILYRIFRSPILFFSIVPIYVFWIKQLKKPLFFLKYLIWNFIIFKIGGTDLVIKQLLAEYLTSIIGTISFHLQHQVNIGYWKHFDKKSNCYDKAHLHGSSILKIPFFLKWAFLGIEYHHIHHLNQQIPGYNLQKCYEDAEYMFTKTTKVGYLQSFLSCHHTLYDEKSERYISFPLERYLGLEY